MTKLHRLIKIIGLLQVSRGERIDGLATTCGVGRRTIFRDLNLLREAGLPLVFDMLDQRYRLPSKPFLPAKELSPDEALSLIVLGHELGSKMPTPFFATARSAAVKLEASLPAAMKERLRHVSDAVVLWPQYAHPEPADTDETIYNELLAAIAARRAVRIRYYSRSQRKELATKLLPYKLLFTGRDWRVIGRSQLHASVRTFPLSRIGTVSPLSQKFSIPAGFSVERYLKNAWHLRPEGPLRKVVVQFSRAVADEVAEVRWHASQKLQTHADGSLELSVSVCGLREISTWILGYGDDAQVLFPMELRRLVARRAMNMVANYAQFSRKAA